MKNPLELTLNEIECMMREAGESAPESEFTLLVTWIHNRQRYLAEYQLQKQAEIIRAKKPDLTRRAARSLEMDLLDNAPVEFVELTGGL